MTECSNLSDRMPAVAHGTSRWDAAEAAHLESCASCRREWELVRAGASLGAGVGAALDTGRVAQAVLRRLREASTPQPIPGIRRIGRWAVAVAAAAAIIFAVQLARPHRSPPVTGVTAVAVPAAAGSTLEELDGLTADELQTLLESFSPAVEALPHLESAPLDDLKPQELERMLRSLEG
jgi:hypothetical protein